MGRKGRGRVRVGRRTTDPRTGRQIAVQARGRTKPTTGDVGPRQPGPHGVTVRSQMDMWVHFREAAKKEPFRWVPRGRDRSLAGKARRKGQRAESQIRESVNTRGRR